MISVDGKLDKAIKRTSSLGGFEKVEIQFGVFYKPKSSYSKSKLDKFFVVHEVNTDWK